MNTTLIQENIIEDFEILEDDFEMTLNYLMELGEKLDEYEEKNKIDFPNLKFNFRSTLIKDFTKYSLGAHTDAFSKFITYLFYIPSNDFRYDFLFVSNLLYH